MQSKHLTLQQARDTHILYVCIFTEVPLPVPNFRLLGFLFRSTLYTLRFLYQNLSNYLIFLILLIPLHIFLIIN